MSVQRAAAITLGLVWYSHAWALPEEFWGLLRSPDHATRLETIQAYGREQGSQRPEDVLRVILIALDDNRDDVRLEGAYLLQRLARTGELSGERPNQELIAQARQKSLRGIETGSEGLAAQLAVAHTLLGRDSKDFEERLIQRLATAKDLRSQREFIDALAWNGLLHPEARNQLFELASGPATIAAHESAVVLAASENPADDLITVLLRLASSDDFFCDPRLLKPLTKSPAAARKRLAEIRALNARLQTELAIDPFKRKTRIYAPQHWSDTMRYVITTLEGSDG